MDTNERTIIFPIVYLFTIETIIQISARLISSGGMFFCGNLGNYHLYNITEAIIRIFFIATTVYTVTYWTNVKDKLRFFTLIDKNFIVIYVSMSFMLMVGVNRICF